MTKEKLLFIVNVDWFFVSHRLPIALEALKSGYEVHLLCAITNQATHQYLEHLGLIVHPHAFSRSGKNIFKELICIIGLYKQMKIIKPKLVHLVSIKPVIYGGIVARIVKIPSVISAISGLGFLFIKRKGLQAQLLRQVALFLYRRAMGHPNQRVIFQNSTDMDALIIAGGVQKDKTRMIRGSGVNLQDFPIRPESDGVPIVVMASRLLKDKGVYEFVEAARIINSGGIKAHFQLIGEPDFGNPESVSEKQVQIWQEEGIVECLDFRSDIAKLFSQAHVVALPSYREGLPKVLIEAAACGRAVVTTDVPGCRDAIEPDRSGILVPSHNARKLAQAIDILIEDNTLRQQMGIAGRDLAEREFDIKKIIADHFTIYHELLKTANT